MAKRGFIFDLLDEISNAPLIHQRLIKSFEDKYNEFWNMLWEIYVRIENYTRKKGLAKYLLSRNGGIEVQMQIMKIGT